MSRLFTRFSTQVGLDSLLLFDGPSTSSPLLANLSGTPIADSGLSSFTAASTMMTLQFLSDAAGVSSGFSASLITSSTYYLASACPGPRYLYLSQGWTNVALTLASNYANNMDCAVVLVSQSPRPITLSFNQVATQGGADVIYLYDGPWPRSVIGGLYFVLSR